MKKILLTIAAFAVVMSLCQCSNGGSEKSQGDGNCKNAAQCQSSCDNQAIKAIMERRSIRKYKDTPVEHEKLAEVVKCGINAPSGMNKQPWEIRVVESQDLINQVNEVYKKANPDIMQKDPSFKNMFRNAPNLICVAAQNNAGLDCGLLGENMMIAAQSLGLGTCCLGGPVRFLKDNADAKFFIDKLEFSEGYDLIYILAIGYPDESPDAKPRDESKVKFIK
ncbi:MAG: nitroreductase [Bacteroidales bacterium]|nr:nitroreductase [Bacteroidales bacterium]